MRNIKHAYIHIPFCSHICSYCDFAKMYYNENLVNQYLEQLDQEVEDYYQNEVLETVYIGGGTPSSLTLKQLERLFKIINKFHLVSNYEMTFECNIENITIDKIKFLKEHGVNRLSFGIQTFNSKFLKLLNRHHTRKESINIIKSAKMLFDNINVDLMYGFPNQTLNDLEKDLELFLSLGVSHISTYSLILEENTLLYLNKVTNCDEDLECDMYYKICDTLKTYGYNHYEISNFSKDGFKSKHNLSYWDNLQYYGFGLGASGYIDNIRYDNTRSINNYLRGSYRYQEQKLNKNDMMSEEMILGLRKLEGVNLQTFQDKYGVSLLNTFKINDLIEKKFLVIEDGYIFIPADKLYISNSILIRFIGGPDE